MQKTIMMPFGSTARAHSSMVQCIKLNGPETLPAVPSSLPFIWLYRQMRRVVGDGLAAPGACRAAKRVMTPLHGVSAGQPRPGARMAVHRQPRFTQRVGDRLPHHRVVDLWMSAGGDPLMFRLQPGEHGGFQAQSGTSAGPSPPRPLQPVLHQVPSRPCQMPRLASSRLARSACSGAPAWYSRSRSETSLGNVTP